MSSITRLVLVLGLVLAAHFDPTAVRLAIVLVMAIHF
jgi:hypothetical protein